MHWHRCIRHAYPDARLIISGETLDNLVVTNQDTGEPFVFDRTLVEQTSSIVDLDHKWTLLRNKRDRLLADTDWWATSDRTMTAEQTAYRQALRDLPANTADPANPVWPVKPS